MLLEGDFLTLIIFYCIIINDTLYGQCYNHTDFFIQIFMGFLEVSEE